MYSLIDIFLVYFSLYYQNLVMVINFNRIFKLVKRLNRKSTEVKFCVNLIDATTELCYTAIKEVFFHTNMKQKKIRSAFQTRLILRNCVQNDIVVFMFEFFLVQRTPCISIYNVYIYIFYIHIHIFIIHTYVPKMSKRVV